MKCRCTENFRGVGSTAIAGSPSKINETGFRCHTHMRNVEFSADFT